MSEPFYRLAFTLFDLPKRTNNNSRTHWALQHKEAKKWKQFVRLKVGLQRPDKPLERARLILTRVSSSEPDYDGLVSSFKHVIDGLIEAGVIVSDKMSVIGVPEYRWLKGRRGVGSITVEINGEK